MAAEDQWAERVGEGTKKKEGESGHNGVITTNSSTMKIICPTACTSQNPTWILWSIWRSTQKRQFSKSEKKPLGVSTVKETMANWVKMLGQMWDSTPLTISRWIMVLHVMMSSVSLSVDVCMVDQCYYLGSSLLNSILGGFFFYHKTGKI
jgi:uncharacterized membrane protein